MLLFKVFLLASVTLTSLRLLLSVWWNRSHCPHCGYSLKRVKRKSLDRSLGKLLFLPLNRFQCSYFQCDWEGLSVCSEHSIVAQAESLALTQLKAQGLQTLCPLEINVESRFRLLFKSAQNLHESLDQDEFLLYYQPKTDLKTNDIIGMEALLRWQHPESGFIYPSEFIPLADENDLIFPIGRWVLKTVSLQIRQWHGAGLSPLCVSINLSSRQFYQPNLVRSIHKVLSQTGLDPQFLEIEVTEATILQDVYEAAKVLRALRLLGIKTAMDNFGLGNSVLKQLQPLSLDILKIDQSFIRNLYTGSRDVVKIQSFITMAQRLNLTVTAEGVETTEQLRLLRSLGCSAAQGYLFDYPLAAADATDVLQANWVGRRDRTTASTYAMAGSVRA
jgi:EAL domain-containing protein (putative c-di-GMP-specific phosphodiesterase class I)